MSGQDPDWRSVSDSAVAKVKGGGTFDAWREECVEAMERGAVYRRLKRSTEEWCRAQLARYPHHYVKRHDKKHIREELRRKISKQDFLERGIREVVEEVLDARLVELKYRPLTADIVCDLMGLPRPARPSPLAKEEIEVEEGADLGVDCPSASNTRPPSVATPAEERGEEMMDLDSSESEKSPPAPVRAPEEQTTELRVKDEPRTPSPRSDQTLRRFHELQAQLDDQKKCKEEMSSPSGSGTGETLSSTGQGSKSNV